MTIHDRIKARRKECGLSADAVAAELGVSRATIYRYESAEIANMGVDKIEPLARVLHTTPEYLMGWTDDPIDYEDGEVLAEIPLSYMELCDNDPRRARALMLAADRDNAGADTDDPIPILPQNAVPVDPSQYHRIPILGRIAAGLPIYAEENIEGYTLTDLNGGAEYFALRVKGDSMNAIGINDGYLIIVRRQAEVAAGEVAVVMVGDDDATVKRFYSTDTTVTLMPQSTNPTHQPQIYDLRKTPIAVLGKVVKVEFTL